MASSTTTSESVEFSATRKKSERSSFSQTCSLLSQYLKEKGSFGELSLGMAAPPATNHPRESTRRTMNLFPGGVESPMDSDPNLNPGHSSGTNLLRSMDLFPQQACSAPYDSGYGLCSSVVNQSVAAVPTIDEPKPSQMTIFYGGRVIVFEDFPADKAREIMLMASQGSIPAQSVFPSSHVAAAGALAEPTAVSPLSSGISTIPINVQPNSPAIPSDLPLARRASLHRFLEKRKDRITSKAPYQINSPMTATSKPKMEKMGWLGLSAPH